METKETILKMLQEGKLTLKEALTLLEAADKPEKQSAKEDRNAILSEIAQNILGEEDNDTVIRTALGIMTNMNWKYYGEPVTFESVYDMIKDNIIHTLEILIDNPENPDAPYAFTECGCFRVEAYVNEDNDVDIDIAFIPLKLFGSCSYEKIKSLK